MFFRRKAVFEETLIKHCSPTLAGLKTGSMFVFRFCGEESLAGLMRDYNSRLADKGVRLTLLRKRGQSALVYVYRPEKLKNDLQDETAGDILFQSGYRDRDPVSCLKKLRSRLHANDGFPHEVGLFLGYPPDDVRGFIENRGACSKCCGCWKVYGNVEESQKCFERYHRCRQIFYQQWSMGTSVEHLTVPA